MGSLHCWLTWGVVFGLFAVGGLGAVEARQVAKQDKQKPEPRTYAFRWQNAPWTQVLKRLAEITGLPVITTHTPTGSFTFIPPKVDGKEDKKYTIPEIIDILNEALLAQKFIIVRRQASLGVFPADEPLDPSPSRTVRIEDLQADNLAKTELVRVVYPLKHLTAETVAPGVKKMMGPFGQVVALAEPNQLVLIDTVANLRTVIAIIRDIGPTDSNKQTWSHKCLYCKASVAAEKLKELLSESPRARRTRGVQVAIASDDRTNTVFVSGPPGTIAMARLVVEKLDVPDPGVQPGPKKAPPMLKTYRVPAGNADPIAKMLLEVYKSNRNIRITAVGSSSIMIYANGEDHIEIVGLLSGCAALGRR
jgi:type II secretory pathway component GspD/PulD (secretin)